MYRRLLTILPAAFLVVGSLSGEIQAGELEFTNVDPMEIRGLNFRGQHEEAVIEAEAAIAGLRPTDNPVTLRLIGELLTYLCEARRNLGKYDQAKAACLEAVATFESVAEVNGMADWALHNLALPELARTYEQMHELTPALSLRERQLKYRSWARGGDPKRVELLTQIGLLHLNLGNFREAEATFLDAIAASGEVWQQDYWQRPIPYLSLAGLYTVEERYDQAEAALKEGLSEIERAHAGITVPKTAVGFQLGLLLIYESLGWTHFRQGRLDDAREAAGKALDIYESFGDEDTRRSAVLKVLLARIADAENPGSPVVRYHLESAVTAPELNESQTSTLHAVAQKELARYYLQNGEIEAAASLARKAVETLRSRLGEYNPETARARLALAKVLQSQGKYDEALASAARAFAAQHDRLPSYHSETGETLALLAELYAVLGQQENLRATESLISDHAAARAKFESEH